MSRDAFREALRRGAPEFGLDLGPETLDRFAKHFDLLVAWNRKINLTRITDPAEAARRHFLESAYLATVLRSVPARLVDVGSGAGFPGVPLACLWPETETVLVEPLVKRAVFLKEVASALGLACVTVRNERFAPEHAAATSVLVARALDRFDELLPALLGSDAPVVALFSAPELLADAAALAPDRTPSLWLLPGANHRFIGVFAR